MWKVTAYCTCGGYIFINQQSRNYSSECPECGGWCQPVFCEYDIGTALNGGIKYIRRELIRLSAYKELPGLNQFDFNKHLDKDRNNDRKEPERSDSEEDERANWEYWKTSSGRWSE